MDPLSMTASVIAVTEGFGFAVKTLKSLADTSSEFSDMLAELSALQALLDQLRLTTDTMTGAQVEVPDNAIRRLELAKVELSQIVNAMGDIRRKLMGDEKEKKLNKKGEPKVSVINWQLNRGRIQKLEDKAKRCREELSACLDLVGLSQQLQQHQTCMDILTISHSHYSLMQTTMVKFEAQIKAQFKDLKSLVRSTQSPKVPVIKPLPEGRCAEPDLPDKMVSRGPGTMYTGRESSTTYIQVPVRQKCSRYCRCQCHRSSALRTPSWSQAFVGSMMLQFSGTVRLNINPCDTPGCKSGKGRQFRVAYAFPSWLTRRAGGFSAYWGSLTDMEGSLNYRVTTVCKSVAGLFDLLYKEDIAGLRERITKGHLVPTDVNREGLDFLLFCLQRQSFRSASLLLEIGFNPSFEEPRTGWSPKQLARHLLLEDKLGLGIIRDELSFQTCAKIAGDMEEEPEVSTLIRDAILGIGKLTLEDAVAVERHSINELDDGGYSPLHWAIRLDKQEQVRQLVEYGADIELPDRYQHKTPLRLAARGSRRRIVAFLLSKGASTTAQDIGGCGMPHSCRDPEVVHMLLGANADPNDARNVSKQTPLHYLMADHKTSAAWPEEQRCDIALQLLRAGCDLEARSSVGKTALLMAVSSGLRKVTGFLHRQGARLDAIDNDGHNILHYTAIAKDLSITDYIRSLEIEGIDPDGGDTPGGTALAYLQKRMRYAGVVGGVWPTQRSVFSFYALISEIRWRNWELGMFLERKQQLERNGHLDNIRRWLGWQWRKMHDDPRFAAAYFHHSDDQFPEDFIDEELEVDYNTDLLFPRLDQVMDNLDPGVLPGISHVDGTEDMEEFFDATE